jgi:hypothetical protein
VFILWESSVLRRGNAPHRAKHSVVSLPRKGCRRPTPRSCAAGASGTDMDQWWSARSNAMANNSNSSKLYSREGQLTILPIKLDVLTLLRCTSAELLSFCCGSVAALALASCNEHVAETNISRPHPPKPSALCTAFKAHSSEGRRKT